MTSRRIRCAGTPWAARLASIVWTRSGSRELHRRDVHGHRHDGKPARRHAAIRRQTSSNTHAPSSRMRPLSSAMGTKRDGRTSPSTGMLPPHEGLGALQEAARGPPGAGRRDSARRRAMARRRSFSTPQPVAAPERLAGLEEVAAAARLLLRRVHRRVRVHLERHRVVRVVGIHADADARPDEDLLAEDVERAPRAPRAGGARARRGRGPRPPGSTRSTQNSSPPMRATRSPSSTAAARRRPTCAQQRVAARVPEGVVHPLEAVEVHEEERDALRLPRAAWDTAARGRSPRGRGGSAGS